MSDQDGPGILHLTVLCLRQQHAVNRWLELTALLVQQRAWNQRIVTGSRTNDSIQWMFVEVRAANTRAAQAAQLNSFREVAPLFLALSRFTRRVQE